MPPDHATALYDAQIIVRVPVAQAAWLAVMAGEHAVSISELVRAFISQAQREGYPVSSDGVGRAGIPDPGVLAAAKAAGDPGAGGTAAEGERS